MMTAHRVLLSIRRLLFAIRDGRWHRVGTADRYIRQLYQRELLDEVLTDIGGEG